MSKRDVEVRQLLSHVGGTLADLLGLAPPGEGPTEVEVDFSPVKFVPMLLQAVGRIYQEVAPTEWRHDKVPLRIFFFGPLIIKLSRPVPPGAENKINQGEKEVDAK